jgi:hypothetical protein
MRKRLIVVGSAPRPRYLWQRRMPAWFGRKIDSFDVVIRCNEIKNSDKPWIGGRTDLLFVRADGMPAHRMSQPGGMPIPPSMRPRRVIFSCDENSKDLYPANPDDPYGGMVFREAILESGGLKDLPAATLPPQEIRAVINLLANASGGVSTIPSMGLLAIHHAITSPEFAAHDIWIAGFKWRGWAGHNWNGERAIIEKWRKQRRLRFL